MQGRRRVCVLMCAFLYISLRNGQMPSWGRLGTQGSVLGPVSFISYT